LACAVFDYSLRAFTLTTLLLLLPFIDRTWHAANQPFDLSSIKLWLGLLSIITLIILVNPNFLNITITTLVFTALPEEWFFRAYFMTQLQKTLNHKWAANVLSSTFFALLHTPTQGWFAISIIIPSLFFGWVYQRNHDIILVILLHTLSNIVFLIYLVQYIN